MESHITGGERLLQCLKEEGVSTLFGILDGSFNPFLSRLEAYGMRFVNSRHEAAAAHMAEAWTRIRGEPAVVIGGIGPGAANMLSGVVTAFAEGAPVIAISSQRRRNIIYPDRGGAFQNVPLLDLFKPITKLSLSVRDGRRLPEMIRKAYRCATSGRPGPVYIEIPEDVMRGTEAAEAVPVWPRSRYRVKMTSAGDADAIAQAARLLASADRPFFHAGAGVSWSGAWDEFVSLADYLSAGISTSAAARGVAPEDHSRYFHPLNRKALKAARTEADVVLVVGARLGELDNWGGAMSWGDPSVQQVIQVDIDPLSFGINRPFDLGIVGDAKHVLSEMAQAVRASTGPKPEHAGFPRYREITEDWKAQLDQARRAGTGLINPGRLVEAVRDFFPRDAITVLDGGNTSLWGMNFNPIYEPRSFLYTTKFGHLGTGLPYAIGAKLAAPDRTVYLISGDGAIGFNIQELETAHRYDVPIIVVVACDGGWGMERSSQQFAQFEHLVETELSKNVRYDRIAEAFGCHGERVVDPDALQPALQRAVDSGRPALIQTMVDPVANMAPPGLLEFGSMVYRSEA